jgi:hypothetical protein
MNLLLQSGERTLVSLSAEELLGITNALNEVCHGIQIPESEFQARVGVTREFLVGTLAALRAEAHPSRRASELVSAWEDHGSVMVRVVTAFGDPVEMGETAVTEFAEQLRQAIAAAM